MIRPGALRITTCRRPFAGCLLDRVHPRISTPQGRSPEGCSTLWGHIFRIWYIKSGTLAKLFRRGKCVQTTRSLPCCGIIWAVL
jgi:hypothetical protein